MLFSLLAHGHDIRVLSPRGAVPSLGVLAEAVGYEQRRAELYSWDGMKRGTEPFLVIQHTLLGEGRLAMALVDSVPAGIYGKAALETLGLWAGVQAQVAQADNVRAALAFVAQGEAPLGIVYATDAAVQDNVTVLGTFPADSHPPITYPAAITAESTHPQAQAFLEHLSSDAARAVWERFGFVVLP